MNGRGFIKSIVLDRGFGFVGQNNSDRDLFFHFRDLVELEFGERLIGQRVRFEVVTTDKGTAAREIRAEA